MTRLLALLAGLLAAMLCGCLKSSGLAGGTSETTNGEYAARIAYADGRPAARALVLLVHEGDWAAKVAERSAIILDSARTGADGVFRMKLPKDQTCNLQIDLVGEGVFARGVSLDSDRVSLPRLTAGASTSLSGHALSDMGPIKEVRLAGTAYMAKVAADGAYAFTGVAPGSFVVVAVMNRGGAAVAVPVKSVELDPGRNQTGFDLTVAGERVVVNDFEQDFWNQTPIGGIAGGGWSATPNGSITLTGGVTSISGEAHAGRSYRAEILFRKSDPAANARIGFSLDASINLSKLSAISLFAMGTGRVYLRFHSRSLNALSGDSVQFQYPIDLQPAWTQVRIPADSLRLTPNAPASLQGVTWSTSAKDILAVDFIALPAIPADADSSSQSFSLDDVTFLGPTLQNLKE